MSTSEDKMPGARRPGEQPGDRARRLLGWKVAASDGAVPEASTAREAGPSIEEFTIDPFELKPLREEYLDFAAGAYAFVNIKPTSGTLEPRGFLADEAMKKQAAQAIQASLQTGPEEGRVQPDETLEIIGAEQAKSGAGLRVLVRTRLTDANQGQFFMDTIDDVTIESALGGFKIKQSSKGLRYLDDEAVSPIVIDNIIKIRYQERYPGCTFSFTTGRQGLMNAGKTTDTGSPRETHGIKVYVHLPK